MTRSLLDSRLALFPVSVAVLRRDSCLRLAIDGQPLDELAEKFGTPLYLYDRSTLDQDLRAYRDALVQYYPGPSGITYAGKAFLCLGIAQWAARQQLWLDCTGAGELAIARAADVSREQVIAHGVNKSTLDLQAALEHAGTLVVDNLGEVERLLEIKQSQAAPLPEIWLRYRPGIAVETHSYTQTGQDDSKFGMSADEAFQAAGKALAAGLPLNGLHFHQGSKFHDPSPLHQAIESAVGLLARIKSAFGWTPGAFSPGGGWGVPYHEDDLPHPPISEYVQFICACLLEACQQADLPLPRLQLEPGRSLVARAGVAVYRVGTVKYSAQRRWLLLDGGLADNPRPALYGARYTALPVSAPERTFSSPAWLAGPFCESGDILIENLLLPEIAAGEFLAVPVSGAYQLSMASNYNGARKPAVVWLQDGQARLIQQRERVEDLFRRDLPID